MDLTAAELYLMCFDISAGYLTVPGWQSGEERLFRYGPGQNDMFFFVDERNKPLSGNGLEGLVMSGQFVPPPSIFYLS